MATFSQFLSLINAMPRTVDLSTNTLSTQGLQLNAATGGGNLTQLAHASTTSYTVSWPAAQATVTGQVLSNDGTGNLSWAAGSAGSVTSVALADGSSTPIYTITNSPVTGTGTLTFSLNTQTANTVFAGPASGSVAQPTFRGLVSLDIPNNAANTSGTAANITATSNATLVTLSALTTASSLASVGTITSGTWTGTTIGVTHGGTGQTSAATAFAALSPMTTAGDIIYENATPAPARLAIGSTGNVLTVSGGLPVWAPPATGGTVSSVAFSDASSTPIYTISGSPVTTSGTLTQTLATQTAALVFAGPATGSAAQPSFRSLAATDIPSLSALYLALTGGTMSGAINMGSNQINALATPSLSTDAATKGYVDAAVNGLTWKGPVQVYSNANVSLTGSTPLVIDGHTVQNGDLILLAAQSTASQDGEYSAAITGGSYVLTANGLPNAIGDAWLVLDGTVFANSAFVATAAVPAATFTEFAGPTAYTFNAPLTLTGNVVAITQSTTSTNGYLSSTDWNTFNGKQASGNYITALTGDASASGPGSAAITFATVNSNVGSFGSSTSIPSFTVNAKGLITAASGNAVVAPAGTLSGTTLNSTVVSSSLTSVGTIISGTWTGTTIAIANGGTGQTSKTASFDALSPLTTAGDTLFYNGSNNVRLGIGSTGQILTVVAGEPAWAPSSVSPGSIALTQNHILVGNASNLAADVSMSGDVAIVASGATTIQAGAVTATKLGTVTDGTTLDQSGAGSALEIKTGGVGTTQLAAASVTAAKLATGAFDQVTIVGGAGTAASVVYSPAICFVGTTGQNFSATNTTVAVRWGITANSETAARIYACDTSTTSFDLFYAIGTITIGASTITTASNVTVTRIGTVTLGSSDPSMTLVGQPVFLASGGGLTQTAPSTAGSAVTRVGILRSTTTIDVNPVPVAVN